MAVRKKVRTVTVLTPKGFQEGDATVTTTYLATLHSLAVTTRGQRAYMYYPAKGGEYVPSTHPLFGVQPVVSGLPLNRAATALAHAKDTVRGPTRSNNQLLRSYVVRGMTIGTADAMFRETVCGTAYFEKPGNQSRYARVVSIRPIAPYHTPNVIADTRQAFEEWSADQFPPQYPPQNRPYFLYDVRGCFVACEHPDDRIRDSWLAASRLRWG